MIGVNRNKKEPAVVKGHVSKVKFNFPAYSKSQDRYVSFSSALQTAVTGLEMT